MNLRNAIGIVLLAGGAAASYWWSRPPPDEPAAPTTGSGEPPGYYIKGARFTVTDEEGRVTLRVNAERLGELPGNDRYALEGVRIEYTPSDETPWLISANSAIAPKDYSLVDFEGEVDMHSTPAAGSKPVQILTAALRFHRGESQATTEGPAEVRVGNLKVTGVRLRVTLNAKTWELESAHGQFSR